jgi:ATP-binding cassette subfamily B multidrug efflux pump
MTLLSALIGVFEAALFALLGHIVDTLVALPREQLWRAGGTRLAAIAVVLLGSIALVALQTVIKHQSLAGNFPMRLRWNFPRLMLAQRLPFYQDEKRRTPGGEGDGDGSRCAISGSASPTSSSTWRSIL